MCTVPHWGLLGLAIAKIRYSDRFGMEPGLYFNVEVVNWRTNKPIVRFRHVAWKGDDNITRETDLDWLKLGIDAKDASGHCLIPLGALSVATFLGAKAVHSQTYPLRNVLARNFNTHLCCKNAQVDKHRGSVPSCGEVDAHHGPWGETRSVHQEKRDCTKSQNTFCTRQQKGLSFAYYKQGRDFSKWKENPMYQLWLDKSEKACWSMRLGIYPTCNYLT